MKKRSVYILLLSLLGTVTGVAQPATMQLTTGIRASDSLLFNIGFNNCDLKQFELLLSDNFEFYHDEAGITNTKAAFIAGVRDNICKLSYRPKRLLIDSTVQIYPLNRNGALYGAIQLGTHQFYAVEKDKPERLTSTAKFTHVWLLENGSFKLSRGMSYDHKEPANENVLFKDRKETEKWLAEHNIPAVGIGYVENGVIKEITVYGHNAQGNPHPDNTIFNVASLTKPVTATVALKLVNAGKWSLDEPIYKYWTDPDIANDPRSKKLTTRHILSHQAGFPNWRYQTGDKLSFQFDPGTKYQYSGEGFEYLRKALENKFGKTLDQLARELVFQPLKMNDTRFYWDETVDEARFAKWYKNDGSQYKTYKNTSANAADDLLTTVEDYSKFMIHIMNGAGLKKELWQEMVSVQAKTKQRQHFGLGWLVDENVNRDEDALTHGGDDKGVHTIVFMLPESKKALLIFTNSDSGVEVYLPAIRHYLGSAGQEIIDIETK